MKWVRRCFLVLIVLIGLTVVYVKTHPLVFNESFWTHQYCIACAQMELSMYAREHEGKFPYHQNGYGDAVALLNLERYNTFNNPGYDERVYLEAKSGRDVPEEKCGRVYVQGLRVSSNHEIAILFDKVPTPGGDHCPGPRRLWAPMGREVLYVGGQIGFIEERDWPEFARNQIELLVKAGIVRAEAERFYVEKAR